MTKYLVTYNVEIEVEADNEDEALEFGIADWEDMPDGIWQVEEIA